LFHDARGSRSSQFSLDGRHDRRDIVLHCPAYDNGVDQKVAMRDAVAHPPHQRSGVAEHPIPGRNVQAGKRLQPGGQPHADGIGHQVIVKVARRPPEISEANVSQRYRLGKDLIAQVRSQSRRGDQVDRSPEQIR
jgi:hypothetical protein